MADPIRESAGGIDLSPRFFTNAAVVTSPTANAITAICNITIPGNVAIINGIFVWGWCAFTVGTSGVSAKLDIRQTGVAGAVIATTGLTTVTAASLIETGCQGLDAAAVLPAQVYSLCLTVTSGAATSTVSAVSLACLVV